MKGQKRALKPCGASSGCGGRLTPWPRTGRWHPGLHRNEGRSGSRAGARRCLPSCTPRPPAGAAGLQVSAAAHPRLAGLARRPSEQHCGTWWVPDALSLASAALRGRAGPGPLRPRRTPLHCHGVPPAAHQPSRLRTCRSAEIFAVHQLPFRPLVSASLRGGFSHLLTCVAHPAAR